MSKRVQSHAILGEDARAETVRIRVDGKTIEAKKGEMIIAALLAEGIIVSRYTQKRHEPRGLFCGIGLCTDCVMVVDGRPNVRTCMTPLAAGMDVRTQDGIEPLDPDDPRAVRLASMVADAAERGGE